MYSPILPISNFLLLLHILVILVSLLITAVTKVLKLISKRYDQKVGVQNV